MDISVDIDEAPRKDAQLLAHLFDRAEEEQLDLHRRAAARAAGIADALAYARQRPWIYALAGDTEPERTAERCAVLEAAARLHLSEMTVRSLAATAERACEFLPLLWARAREAFAAIVQVDAAVALLDRFDIHDESSRVRALDAFDRALAEVSLRASPASFRAKAKLLARRLAPQPDALLHAGAFAQRRVVVESVDDGMSWIHALVTTVDAVAIKRRLTSSAKHAKKASRDGRTRDQLRADLFSEWLRGIGGATAVKTKVFVTVPLDRLSSKARASVRTDVAPRAGIDLSREAQLIGEGPIDDDSALRILLEAGQFTRVVTDPVTGVVLDMDRRARMVTRAQRDWLILTHGLCTRDGCRRSAVDAEIDHWREFWGEERGPTDLSNLHPFCGGDHRTKGTTTMKHRRRRDGTVQLFSPTGFSTRPDPRPEYDLDLDLDLPRSAGSPSKYRPTVDRLLAGRETPDQPPF